MTLEKNQLYMKKISREQKNYPKIISLSIADINACMDLDKKASGGLWSKEAWEKELKERNRLCLGIINGSRLFGVTSASIVLDELQITSIFVHPEHRRKGLASRLLQALLKRGQEQGCVMATLEYKETNFAAQLLYQKVGFKNTGLRNSYYKDGTNAILQSRDLKDLS